MRTLRVASVSLVVLAAACLRDPIGLEGYTDTDDASSTSDGGTTDGLSMSGALDESSGGSVAEPEPACHPAYAPCLPVVGDLDCADVRAMEAAPVEVLGEDPYGLDADGDGIGCED